MNEPISTDDFRMLNRCLDDVIAGAVTEFGRQQNQSTLNGETARGNERTGFLAHEMRNLLNTAIIAFEVLKTGNVGVGGSTGTVLHRSLMRARALTGRSLAQVSLIQGVQNREQFPVAGFIDELALAATMEGSSRGIELRVMPVEDGIVIEADRQVLTAVVMNLVQNAFKFTRAGTTVVLRVGASAERVLIEVEDECGGLPNGNGQRAVSPVRAARGRSNRSRPRSRLQPGGGRSEQRSHLCAQRLKYGMRLHRRPPAGPGACHGDGIGSKLLASNTLPATQVECPGTGGSHFLFADTGCSWQSRSNDVPYSEVDC